MKPTFLTARIDLILAILDRLGDGPGYPLLHKLGVDLLFQIAR